MRGAGLTRGAGHLDHQMNLEHAAPRCSSRQQFRLIAGETSRAILNGRIHIHPGAGKTDAELQARGLLLTRGAEIDLAGAGNLRRRREVRARRHARPARCHSALLSALAGIGEAEARALLGFAFLAEVIEALPLAAVRELVRPVLHDAFVAQEPQS